MLVFNCIIFIGCLVYVFFFFKQKTAYEMRISDWSSDVCSSDLCFSNPYIDSWPSTALGYPFCCAATLPAIRREFRWPRSRRRRPIPPHSRSSNRLKQETARPPQFPQRSEEHTSELQSLMRISYAVFCLKKKKKTTTTKNIKTDII